MVHTTLRSPLSASTPIPSRAHCAKNCRIIASSMPLLLLLSSVCHGLVETCEELQAAFELTETQDVVIEIYPYIDIICANFTTMTMSSNSLTVKSSEDLRDSSSNFELHEVRFNVTNGAKLSWEPNVEFHGTEFQDVNGGALFIGEGSTAHFLNRLVMEDIRIASVNRDSDFANYLLSGGCVYTDGYLRVDGAATFTGCTNAGGGESNPGPGGSLYIGQQGSMLFRDSLDISDSHLDDDGGHDGGGIYNQGNVVIEGTATFDNLWAYHGSAIYNVVGATLSFKNPAAVEFINCLEPESKGGALYNEGYMDFSGPALFYDSGNPAITISSDGGIILSEPSVFWGNFGTNDPFVLVKSGGHLVIPTSTLFIDNDDSDCSTVYYEENETCL